MIAWQERTDLLIATIALVIGGLIVAATLRSSPFLLAMPTVQKIRARCGEIGMRWVLLSIGAALMGVALFLTARALNVLFDHPFHAGHPSPATPTLHSDWGSGRTD